MKRSEINKLKLQKLRDEALRTTPDLCKTLAAIAALHIEDERAQKKIYQAVRHLQILAGLPEHPTPSSDKGA